MTLAATELTLSEFEDESGHHGEYEAEFFRTLAGLARRAAKNPTLRRVGLAAARQAAAAIPSVAGSVGRPGSAWATLGRDLGTTVSNQLLDWIPQQEFEGEYEINPIAKVYPATVTAGAMEHLGRAAAEAEDAAHAEAFVGALVPYGLSLARAAAPLIARATPQLIKGAANMTRTLRADPATQPLVRMVPGILRAAVANLARQASAGQQPTPPAAVRALATQAAHTLTNPNRCVQAYRRSQALDRGYHQAIGR
jgi:hypothetical protein